MKATDASGRIACAQRSAALEARAEARQQHSASDANQAEVQLLRAAQSHAQAAEARACAAEERAAAAEAARAREAAGAAQARAALLESERVHAELERILRRLADRGGSISRLHAY